MERRSDGLVGRRVLVIEDESLLVMLLEDFLESIGCVVAGVASGFPAALEKAQALSFDVAILDVNLNGRQSFPIAEALVGRNLPFVFATGYGVAALPPALRDAPVLQKPFQQRQLEQALRQALAAKGPA
jgi:CheY-like chemotaxis protein